MRMPTSMLDTGCVCTSTELLGLAIGMSELTSTYAESYLCLRVQNQLACAGHASVAFLCLAANMQIVLINYDHASVAFVWPVVFTHTVLLEPQFQSGQGGLVVLEGHAPSRATSPSSTRPWSPCLVRP